MKKKTVAALLGGAAVGAGLGILFAPKKGEETRADLKAKMDELVNKARDIDMDDVKEYVVTKTDEIEASLKDLDKEKVVKIAQKKASELKKHAEELVTYTKKKATPIVEEAAEALRQKAIEGTKKVLDKLENK